MLTTKEIMDIIPHRHPFLLVDTIDELEPGIKATGYKFLTLKKLSQDILQMVLDLLKTLRLTVYL